jgi:hypothetical protein
MCALDGDADRLVYFYVKDTVKENATFMSQTAFAECDTDGDGQLSKDEFAVWHREHSNRDPTDAEWKHFHEADKNGDGSISRLEAGAVPGLLDGDKIAALATAFIKEQLDVLGLTAVITVGVVQTAYANGAASAYVQDAKVPVAFVPTGVKHLHKAAHECVRRAARRPLRMRPSCHFSEPTCEWSYTASRPAGGLFRDA